MSEVTAAGGAGSPMTAEERAAKLLRDYRAEVVGPWFADVIAAAIRAAEVDAGEAVARRAADVVRAAEPFIGKGWAKSLADEIERDAAAIRARGTAP